MGLNEKVSITLGDDKMFGIGVINGIITGETFENGIRSISVNAISPMKTPYQSKESDPKQELEFSRYKQDCRKRAFDLAHNEVFQPSSNKFDDDVIKRAEIYYNWLISIPQ